MALVTDEIKIGREELKKLVDHSEMFRSLLHLESRKSFYSAHSAFFAYSATFVVLFIHSLVPRADLLLSTVKVLIFVCGLYPGMTQTHCFFHYWTDVLTGYTAGIAFALYAFHWVQ